MSKSSLFLSFYFLLFSISIFSFPYSVVGDRHTCDQGLDNLPPKDSALFFHAYNNTAFSTQSPTTHNLGYLPYLSFNSSDLPFPTTSFSLQWLGHLTVPITGNYSFSCTYATSNHLLLWFDDHLLCPPDGNTLLSLPWQAGQSVTVRMEYIQTQKFDSSTSLSVRWSPRNDTNYQPIPSSVFHACQTASEAKRHELRYSQLHSGWATLYTYDLAAHTLLPDSLSVAIGFYQISTGQYTNHFYANRQINGSANDVTVRPGPRSYVGDSVVYSQLQVTWKNILHVIIESSVDNNNQLVLLLTSRTLDNSSLSDFLIVISTSYLWDRQGSCSTNLSASDEIFANCTGNGLSTHSLYSNAAVNTSTLKGIGGTYAAFNINPAKLFTFSINRPLPLAEVVMYVIAGLRSVTSNYSVWGASVTAQTEVVSTTVAWLQIYTPWEGIMIIVSRSPGWNFNSGYVLFEWDTYFGAYMTCFLQSEAAKRLCFSSYIQTIHSITSNDDGTGFFPNYQSGSKVSRDRTEPPVAARILLEILQFYGANDPDVIWLIELCIDRLYIQNTWMWRHRRLAPLGLISLGSDPNLPLGGDIEVNDMQAARFESGLDNSPMYDGEFFNTTSHQMELYDVGHTGLFLLELNSLLAIINLTGIGTEFIAEFTMRYNTIAAATQANLWSDSLGFYSNRYSTGSAAFYPRVSPTLVFPLGVGLPSIDQAERSILRILTNASELCVNKSCPGEAVPSISRSDSAYGDQSYWRGRVWGPHLSLVYWALSNSKYASSAIVQDARHQLVAQSRDLYQLEWVAYRHIHENYDGNTGEGCNNGNSDPFYSWGALSAFLSILEVRDSKMADQMQWHPASE